MIVNEAMKKPIKKTEEEDKAEAAIRLEAYQRVSFELHEIVYNKDILKHLDSINEEDKTWHEKLNRNNAMGAMKNAVRIIREELLKHENPIFRDEVVKHVQAYLNMTPRERRQRYAHEYEDLNDAKTNKEMVRF
jgi:hypothetical protein